MVTKTNQAGTWPTPFYILNRHVNVLVVFVGCACVIWLSLNPYLGTDIWWHILIGRSILFDHTWPWADTFTYTIPGKQYVIHSWLSDCVFALLYDVGGEILLRACRFVTFVVYASLLASFAKRTTSSSALAAAFAVFGIYLVHDRYVRPYIFPPLLAVLLIRAVRDPNTTRRLIKEFMYVLLWANLHPSFPFGVALAIYCELHASRNGPWFTAPLLFCLLLSGVSFLQPQGIAGLFYPFRAMQFPTGDWSSWLDPGSEFQTPSGVVFCYVLVIAACATSAVALIRERAERPELVQVGVAIFVLLASLTAKRFLWFLVVSVCLCAPALRLVFQHFRPRKNIAAWSAIALCVLLGCAKIEYRNVTYCDPIEAIAFMRDCGMQGNAFVFLPWTGRLLHDLNQRIRVFIDTRIEPFVPVYFQAYRAVLLESDLTLAILSNTDIVIMPNSLFRPSRLRPRGEWLRVWSSVNESIYIHKTSKGNDILEKMAQYYEVRNIRFSKDSGISVLDSLQSNFNWSVQHLFRGEERTAEKMRSLLVSIAQNENKDGSTTVPLYHELGNEFMKCRMFAEAASCFREALKWHSSSVETELALAQSLFATGVDPYALDCLKRILRHDPANVLALELWLSYAIRSSHQRAERGAAEQVLKQNGTVVSSTAFHRTARGSSR